ncbi:LysR family transcriptional regulator [Paenibacillus shenyangensis]|uniref:LysR family transcriptional regulator n=1 Tax=Paenibacillus sp. A9 TaxID=1284352 RepID=UPI00036D5DD0|nr:LysR family transcriptional regulator [Paenibacillus sp. A9]
MDLKELIAFQTIVQERTFSRAAEKLNYAQSTITNQIQRLEKELGIQLFQRGWEVQLTPAGRIFAAEVDHLIQHWQDTAKLARALQHDEIGSLRIGGIESVIHTVIPDAVRQFQQHKPRVACQITAGNTDMLARELLEEKLDFAICGSPSDASAFYFEPLYEETTILVVDQEHPLCGQQGIFFDNVLDYPMTAGGHTCLYHLQLAKYMSSYRKSPALLNTMTPISLIPQMVRNTLAIGVVLESTPLIPGVQKIDVQMELPSIPVGLLQLRKQHYSPESSVGLLQSIIKKQING